MPNAPIAGFVDFTASVGPVLLALLHAETKTDKKTQIASKSGFIERKF
jgi:hypothetical protein